MSALGPPRASDSHRAVLMWAVGFLALATVGHWVYRARLHERERLVQEQQQIQRQAQEAYRRAHKPHAELPRFIETGD